MYSFKADLVAHNLCERLLLTYHYVCAQYLYFDQVAGHLIIKRIGYENIKVHVLKQICIYTASFMLNSFYG